MICSGYELHSYVKSGYDFKCSEYEVQLYVKIRYGLQSFLAM